MTIDITASTDHVQPYPIVPSAPCCGQSVTDREPIPPGWMMLDGRPLDGIVTENRQVMHPTLRGLGCGCGPCGRCGAGPCRCGLAGTRKWGPRPTPRLGGLGELCAFDSTLLEEAREIARGYVSGLELPPSPVDVIDSIWRLAEIEREIISLRTKLQTLRAAGALMPADVADFDTLRRNYYKAALAFYTPVLRLVAATQPLVLRFMPALSMPAGIDGPAEELPWVPNRSDLERIRRGDLTGFSRGFQSIVDEIQRRLSGGGTRGLGDIVIGGVTISTALLACIVVVAVVVVVIALAVNATAIAEVLVSWSQSFAHARTLDARAAAYRDCIARPGATPTECSRVAERLAPPPQFRPLNTAAGVGLAVGALAVGAAWFFFGTERGARVRAQAFSGVRKTKRRGRTLRW